jgi:hypothetical protein
MAISTTVATIASLAFSAYSTMQQQDAQDEARSKQAQSDEEQRKIRAEQKASQAAQSAAERRSQLREERLKRARVIQSGENTGVTGSSGVAGAIGNMNTQLQGNIGFNVGQERSAGAIGVASQNSADFLSSANNSMVEANQWGQAAGFGMNIFNKVDGFNNIFSSGTQAPALVTTATPTVYGP